MCECMQDCISICKSYPLKFNLYGNKYIFNLCYQSENKKVGRNQLLKLKSLKLRELYFCVECRPIQRVWSQLVYPLVLLVVYCYIASYQFGSKVRSVAYGIGAKFFFYGFEAKQVETKLVAVLLSLAYSKGHQHIQLCHQHNSIPTGGCFRDQHFKLSGKL